MELFIGGLYALIISRGQKHRLSTAKSASGEGWRRGGGGYKEDRDSRTEGKLIILHLNQQIKVKVKKLNLW